MRYLHLVYLSDRISKATDGRCADAAVVRGAALEELHCEPSALTGKSGVVNGLVTDGPFIETKEYRA